MSLKKYKQSGFTLIELMVVMAIMAILATAGLSAYTGYIKKARDAKRMADIHAINKIVLANMSISGLPPQTIGELRTAIKNANNGRLLRDPLVDKNVCGPNGASQCYYYYGLCSAGNGYILLTRLESSGNLSLVSQNESGWNGGSSLYDIGSCPSLYEGVIYI